MNRFHVHLNVADLAGSIRFYRELFGAEPSVLKPDYAKWMLEDPRINFAISATGRTPGIDHLGLQVDSGEELAALGQRLEAAGAPWYRNTPRSAATRAPTRPGRKIRKAPAGKPSTPSARPRRTTRATPPARPMARRAPPRSGRCSH